MLYLFLIVLLLNILDVYTTRKILKNNGRELNLVVRKAIEHMGLLTSLVVVKCGALALLVVITLVVGAHWIMYALYAALILIYGFVVARNFRQKPF